MPYFDLIKVLYEPGELTIEVAELVKGEPDGYIGIPLVVNATSRRWTIYFEHVAEFRSRAEPCFAAEGAQHDLTDFLFECVNSEYINQLCPCGVGAREPARHFGIYTESVVLEILASQEPKIEETTNMNRQ